MANGLKGNLYQRVIEKPILTSFCVLLFVGAIVVSLSIYLKLYDLGSPREFLVEAHGMILDIVVFGIVILWLEKMRDKRITIRRYQDEIDDFRFWKADEAAYRIKGNIIRLNKLGVTRIDLHSCYLEGVIIESVQLKNADLSEAILDKGTFIRGNFRNSVCVDARLYNAVLLRADFREANLSDAKAEMAIMHLGKFQGADLTGANLSKADLSKAELHGADLTSAKLAGANLTEAEGLSVEQLANVKTLYQAELDPELKEKISKEHPELLELPKAES
jgi:uncharacterized protein YjbI with pentapeptide repeats